MDAACAHIDERLTPYYPKFIREVTKEDILKLMEIKMGRILKFNSDKADELIARMKEEVAEIDNHLAHIVDYTVNWYQMLKNKYGKNFPRRTELRNFDTIEAAKVVEANEKLYINREEGFIGTALKKTSSLHVVRISMMSLSSSATVSISLLLLPTRNSSAKTFSMSMYSRRTINVRSTI